MRNMSDIIEQYLKQLIEESGGEVVEIKRAHIAEEFECIRLILRMTSVIRKFEDKALLVEKHLVSPMFTKQGLLSYISEDESVSIMVNEEDHLRIQTMGVGLRMMDLYRKADAIDEYAGNLSRFGFTLRGIYGEGSVPLGHIYQLSNQLTLGQTEEEIINNLDELKERIVEEEMEMRSIICYLAD